MTSLLHMIGILSKSFSLFFISIILSIIIHELGHVFFGLLVRRRVIWFAVGPLIIFRNGNFKLQWKNKYFFGATLLYGQTIKNQSVYQKERIRTSFYFLGGPLLSLLSGFIFFYYYVQNNNNHIFLLFLALISCLIGVVTLFLSDGLYAAQLLSSNLFSCIYFLHLELNSHKTTKQFDFLLSNLENELQKVQPNSINNISNKSLQALYSYLYCAQLNFNIYNRRKIHFFQEILKEIESQGLCKIKSKQKRSLLSAIIYIEEINLILENNTMAAESLYSKLHSSDHNKVSELKRLALIKGNDEAYKKYIKILNADIFNRDTLFIISEEQFVLRGRKYVEE
ncbi:site-2 protease family protein [Bacillus swezeyi]|uniref:site-2 protease family protein n=2 Tax=Bacillus swezeyi TaxID=1925020 RepID=UPI0039C6A5A3